MWVHIHKAAGTTMCKMAREMAESVAFPVKNCNYLGVWFDGYKALATGTMGKSTWTTCSQRRKLFKENNFTWAAIEREVGEGDLCFNDFVYGTVVRQPIDRMESSVNFEEFWYYGEQIACIKRGQCKDQGKFTMFDNYMVRSLLGYDGMWLPPGGVTKSHLQKAVRLLERFDLVLPLEFLDCPQVVAKMDRVLGWHVATMGRRNDHFHAIPFSEGERNDIREINRYDRALYEHFAAKFSSCANK